MNASTGRKDPASHVEALRTQVERALAALTLPAQPANLYDPVRFVLEGGGKRLRPILTLLSGEAFGVSPDRAMPMALAVEVFHNFTLVHDDIMDGASERRGRPTVHVRWDEGDAILAGDLMMGMAYDLLFQTAGADLGRLSQAFNRMVVRLCEGQALDKSFESRSDVGLDAYMRMIDGKTAALLELCLKLGGLAGGAGDEDLALLEQVGRSLGRAFQIQDDLLDLTAVDPGWGKRVGGDLIVGKKTYLLLTALERADAENRAWFGRILVHRGLPEAEIPEARARMERLGVLDHTREALRSLYEDASRALGRLSRTEGVAPIAWVIDRMAARAR